MNATMLFAGEILVVVAGAAWIVWEAYKVWKRRSGR